MKKTQVFIACLGIFFCFQTAFAQSPNNPVPDFVIRNQQKRDEQEALNRSNRQVSADADRRLSPAEREKSKKAEEEKIRAIAEINEAFAAPAEYYAKYAEFLKAENTGLARMFPDQDCGQGLTVTVKELERCGETPQIKGAGSLYSVKLEEIPAYLPLPMILDFIGRSEIHFIGDRFVVGNASTLGIIGEIGSADLDDVNLKSAAFRFLKDFEPAKTKIELARQNAELERGISSGGVTYSNSALVKLDAVYVLRAIAFREQYRNFWAKNIFVAFKIVGREKDGSVVFVWKKLKEKDAPVLRDQ